MQHPVRLPLRRRTADPEALHNERLALFVISTYEEGGAPRGAAWFCRWLAEAAVDERVGGAHLATMRFAVAGCGNSLYGAVMPIESSR